MIDVGTIEMRMPSGRKSSINVSVLNNGTVDIVVQRSSEGEALIRLPRDTARELSHLLAKATFIPTT